MKNWLMCLAALLLLSPAAMGQEDSEHRQKLDSSLGWGIDRDSGKIAVDPFLLYFYDPADQVLVINGAAVKEALAEAGAEVQADGSWRMSDGAVLKPLVGEVAIFLGDEPEELREVLKEFPATKLDRVQLSTGVSPTAERSRWFKRCNRCTACISGCWGQELYQGGNFKTCGSGGIFNTCKESGRTDYCTPTLKFSCDNCSGSLLSVTNYYNWGCALDC